MLEYKTTLNRLTTNTTFYNIIKYNKSEDGRFFLFETKVPHNLKNGYTINIGSNLNIPIMLRTQVRIGVGYDYSLNTFFLRWKYIDNFKWSYPTIINNNFNTNIELDNGLKLMVQVDNNLLSVKPDTSLEWQYLINLDNIDIHSNYSTNSIIKSFNLNDNFFYINSFDLLTKVPIIGGSWNKTNTQFVFRINYFPILTPNKDKLQVVLNYLDSLNSLDGVERVGDIPVHFNELFNFGNIENNGLYNTIITNEHISPFLINYLKVLEYDVKTLCNVDYYELIINSVDGIDDLYPDTIIEIYKEIDIFTLEFWRDNSYFGYEIDLKENNDIRTSIQDLINTEFYNIEKEKAINKIKDLERIRFSPVCLVNDGSSNHYKPVKTFKYNFYFRNNKGWDNKPTYWYSLGFNNDDVKYQKNRLQKTFMRLSYFDEKNPTKQSLLYYNTVFVNTKKMFGQYIRGGTPSRINQDMITNITNEIDFFTVNFEVHHPLLGGNDKSMSSEGYYIYLLKEDNDSLIPQNLYIKIEFNNALDGKRSLFFNRLPPEEGVNMNNIFLTQNNNEDYTYLKFNLIYDELTDDYLYYPSIIFNETGDVLLTDSDITYDENSGICNINIYEAKVI